MIKLCEVVLKEPHMTSIGDLRPLWGIFSDINMFHIVRMCLRLVPWKRDESNVLKPKKKLIWVTLHEKDHKEQYKPSLRDFRPPSRIRVPLLGFPHHIWELRPISWHGISWLDTRCA